LLGQCQVQVVESSVGNGTYVTLLGTGCGNCAFVAMLWACYSGFARIILVRGA